MSIDLGNRDNPGLRVSQETLDRLSAEWKAVKHTVLTIKRYQDPRHRLWCGKVCGRVFSVSPMQLEPEKALDRLMYNYIQYEIMLRPKLRAARKARHSIRVRIK